MAPIAQFSVADRRREKQDSRARDEVCLARGDLDPQEVRDRNGFFSALDASKAKIVSRRIRVRV